MINPPSLSYLDQVSTSLNQSLTILSPRFLSTSSSTPPLLVLFQKACVLGMVLQTLMLAQAVTILKINSFRKNNAKNSLNRLRKS